MKPQNLIFFLLILGLGFLATACKNKSRAENEPGKEVQTTPKLPENEPPLAKIPILREITIGSFFKFLDETVRQN